MRSTHTINKTDLTPAEKLKQFVNGILMAAAELGACHSFKKYLRQLEKKPIETQIQVMKEFVNDNEKDTGMRNFVEEDNKSIFSKVAESEIIKYTKRLLKGKSDKDQLQILDEILNKENDEIQK